LALMHKILIRVLLLVLALSFALGAEERVMVGDDIFVGPDERLDNVVCVGCAIHIEGRADDVVAVGGRITVAEGAVVRDVVAIAGGLEMRGEAKGDVVSIIGGSD